MPTAQTSPEDTAAEQAETTDNAVAATQQDQKTPEPKNEPPHETAKPKRSVAIPLSTMVAGSITVIAVGAAVVLAVFLVLARGQITDRDQQAADDHHAEQVATDYAVGAATIRFDDISSWIGRLKAGTSPQLANKFDATAPKLEDILTPLKWTSTASPITAKVSSSTGGVYKVDVFVNVSSTNAQNPDGAQTTVTYNVTLDKNADWKITDVGGVNAALPVK